MKVLSTLLLLAAAPLRVQGGRLAAQVTPVQKVIEMLTSMLERAKSDKHEEQIQMSAYNQFCTDTAGYKKKDIEETEEKIEMLKADIQKSLADADKLEQEIAGHQADAEGWKVDMVNATKVRKEESMNFRATLADYTESVEALEEAILYLKSK